MATEVPHQPESTMNDEVLKVQSFTVWWIRIKILTLDTHSGNRRRGRTFIESVPVLLVILYSADKKLMLATESLLVIQRRVIPG